MPIIVKEDDQMVKALTKNRVIYDPINGFVKLTQCEWDIIHSPFYQRLRWIKQLGFSCYVFPGAEHSRFGHSIGVMHNAHLILKSCNRAVDDGELFDSSCVNDNALYHKSIRLAALMHDLGTMPFSHTTEAAYISFGDKDNRGSTRKDDHEHLGSFIIKNTDYPNGITKILQEYGIDPSRISNLVKGIDPSIMANQILHSEVDCDRMDYLLRDAHYTGLNYGTYDRDYLLHHFQSKRVGDHDILTIRHNALHCVEDFLMSRFAWYSQVIRSARGARFDAIAEELTKYFLENNLIYSYHDLLDMIRVEAEKFYSFNDIYFMSTVHRLYLSGALDKKPRIKELAYMLLFEKAPKSIRLEVFNQRLLSQDEAQVIEKVKKKATAKVDEIQAILSRKGGENDWIVTDLPRKNIVFVKSYKRIIKDVNKENVLLTRDPTKISFENGSIKLLAEVENSIISTLQDKFNYVPNVFCPESTLKLLIQEGVIKEDQVN